MKKIIALAIMCLITVNVFAMERELMPGSEKPFLVDAAILQDINRLPENFTITSEELQEVGDVLPDAPQWRMDTIENYSNSPTVYECRLCSTPKTFSESGKLRSHECSRHFKKMYICMHLITDNNPEGSICLERFLTGEGLTGHKNNQHKGYLCYYCLKKKPCKLEKLHRHILEYHGTNISNPCLLCKPYTPFKTGSELYLHLREKHDFLNWPE